MGARRKSAPRQVAKKGTSVAKTFKCPFCSHDDACEVKLDRKTETGAIGCRVCGENFQCRITPLSDPVDVFCEWTDALEEAQHGECEGAACGATRTRARARGRAHARSLARCLTIARSRAASL